MIFIFLELEWGRKDICENLRHLVENSELNGVDLVGPLFNCNVASAVAAVLLFQLQDLVDLIDSALDCAVNRKSKFARKFRTIA